MAFSTGHTIKPAPPAIEGINDWSRMRGISGYLP